MTPVYTDVAANPSTVNQTPVTEVPVRIDVWHVSRLHSDTHTAHCLAHWHVTPRHDQRDH